jgi:hypothetical protein
MSDPVVAPPRSRAAVRLAWIDRLQRFDAAGLTVLDFCRAEGVSTQAFYYWRHKLADPPTDTADTPRLLPVRLVADHAPVELVLPSGAILRLSPGCDLAFVRAVLDALGGPPC